MKKIVMCASLLVMVSCSSPSNNTRHVSSVGHNLNGTYLGVAEHKAPHEGPDKAATRIYLQEIEGEAGKYHAVLLEYVDLLKMAPSYIASNKLPFIAKRTGYLKNITTTISTYEVVPGAKQGTFEMWPLAIKEDRIEANHSVKPRILTLSVEVDPKNPLAGATISSVRADEPTNIFFPKKDDNKKNGIQYATAKLAYEKVKLESTWRKSFLRGPYLSQYYRKDDLVLKLSGNDNNHVADFVLNEKMSKLSTKKRSKMFTNEKSAFLKGEFSVTEPLDGMFVFRPVVDGTDTANIVKGRIGLFIDIFDATKSLNQDVVELALIDPEKPEDFLMYYEHPENGEGKYK